MSFRFCTSKHQPDGAKPIAVEAAEIVPGIWYVGSCNYCCYLIRTNTGPVMVDSGMADQSELYVANLRRAGCEPADLVAILHTHNHSDHIGATAKLVEVSGAKTMIGEADAPLLAAKAPVSRLLRDGDIIEFAGTQFTFLHTPGHTRGSGVYLLEQNGVRVCFIGDAAGPFIFEDVRWEGDAEAFRSSADRMKTVVADLYLPGHPHQTMEVSPEGNPRLTREQWHRFIDDRVRIMESTISRQGA